MSGGFFEYADQRAKNEIFGYLGDETKENVFEDEEISELVWDVFQLIRDFDWYKSCDTCEEKYLEKKSAFKNKWFKSDRKVRLKGYVDERLKEVKDELYRLMGVEDETKN